MKRHSAAAAPPSDTGEYGGEQMRVGRGERPPHTPGPAPLTPWRGRYIEVLGDGSWRFHSCVRCDEPLTSTASQAKGLGPGCSKVPGAESQARRRLQQDRAEYRRRVLAMRQRPVAEHGPSQAQTRLIASLAGRLGREPLRVLSRSDATAEIRRLQARLEHAVR